MPKPGEFEIIERWFTRPIADAQVRVGIGDDAAIVDAAGPLAVAVDMLLAGTHFPAELAADAIGHRVLAVNLSDLAAMGARPRWATLAVSLPDADAAWLESFATGFFRLADRFGVSLIGGDTTRGPLTATVQLIGNAPDQPLLRSSAVPGDRIFVSGMLGDSGAALEHFVTPNADRSADARALLERFSYPEPRIALGEALAGLAHAAIDISDGLLADLGHLCRQSGCGATIELENLPLSPPLRALYALERAQDFALHGGDDYELCFAVAPADIERVRAVATEAATAITEIGELTADREIIGRRDGHPIPLDPQGFVHF